MIPLAALVAYPVAHLLGCIEGIVNELEVVDFFSSLLSVVLLIIGH